jgi:hypothetical protein
MFQDILSRARARAVSRLLFVAAPIAALAAFAAIAAADAVTIGEPGAGGECNTGFDAIQTASTGDKYVVPPGDWLVTEWKTEGGPHDGLFQQMTVWRPTALNTYALVTITPPEQVAANVVNTFDLPSPVAVRGGDLLGLRIPPDQFNGTLYCWTAGTQDDVTHWAFGPELSPGDTLVFDPADPNFWITLGFDPEVLLNVEAMLIPAVPSFPTPTTEDDCKHGGWLKLVDSQGHPFANQGDCVSFVATDGTNLANP